MEQSLKRKFVLFAFIILASYLSGVEGCFEEERKGLLELKEFIVFNQSFKTIYNEVLFQDWVDDKGKNECCEWSRVTCNHTTGHVIELSLENMYIALRQNSWSLNISLFLPFKELQNLDLSYSNIDGWTQTEGFTSLHRLEILDLSWNQFGGSIPPFIWSLSSLKALSLSQNELIGSLTLQGLCELKQLQELDLSINNLEGTLLPCLNNFTSLRLLDLSYNRFTGNISSSVIASLTSLEYIDLSSNHFEGVFSFNSFANHSNLEVVEIISDNTKFVVETESTAWIPMFQLKVLVLSNCNLNKLFGGIPEFLFHQHRLRVLDLSGSNLYGRFPYWLLENNTELEVLDLRKNSFSGLFHLPPFSNFSCFWMDLSENHFSGRIQENIGQILPNIEYLNLSANAFENGIPSSIGNMSDWGMLDFSANNFSGEFPHQVVKGCKVLGDLLLSYNKFHGEFPLALFNSSKGVGTILKLDNNQFTGKLLNDPAIGLNMYLLDISNNFLSGSIPTWISNSTLGFLVLRNNLFQGQLPSELGRNFLDVSHNFLSGSLPLLTKTTYLEYLHLQGNRFTGSIPESYVNLSLLLTLDLGDNSLSGSIPNYIGAFPNLRILLLGRNNFTGFIPNQLCHLTSISMMDLSSNSLSGSIPNCLPNITGPNQHAFNLKYSGFARQNTDYKYESILKIGNRIPFQGRNDYIHEEQDEVNFVTKSRSSSYRGGILDLMSGFDFSCNNLTGEIPIQMGMLVQVLALNLSHNQLAGPIPKIFSYLKKIESLDLSFNSLSGEIPSELISLNFLSAFTVAHNNLSGRVPEMKAQFGTFPKESYEGNPFLCGPQVEKNCTTLVNSSLPTASSFEDEDKWYEIDLVFFYASFVATYFVFLLGAVTLLYINLYWRRRWFTLVEECMYSCYYFLCDSVCKRSAGL